MITDPLAVRVARRHREAAALSLLPRARIEVTAKGHITAAALIKILEPHVGRLTGLQFRASTVFPNTVEWDALGEHGQEVTGRLLLHAAVGEDEVVSWVDVTVDRGA
jgi:hypothetical protein